MKARSIITHTEILARAIGSIENEIRDSEAKMRKVPECQHLLQEHIDTLTPKLEVLKRMYRYETGVEY